MEFVAGTTLDQLTLIECLAEGGTSAVWSAEHAGRGGRVAVKFLSREFAEADPAWRQRVSREAAIGARIGSRNVVEIFEHGTLPDGTRYIVMELLEGIDIARAVFATGPLTLHEMVAVLEQVAGVLDRAHALGIVHRDIKPDNLFLVESDELLVKVLDFGIAKLTRDPTSSTRQPSGPITMTTSGMVLGTPEFMSPEQSISAKDVDFLTDLFSLGMVTYFALTSDLPFPAGGSPTAWRRAELGPMPVRRRRADLPDCLDGWFKQALALQPTERFPSAKAMSESFATLVAPFLEETDPPVSRFQMLDARAATLPAAGAAPEPPSPEAKVPAPPNDAVPDSHNPTHPSYEVPGFTAKPIEVSGSPNEPVLVARRNAATPHVPSPPALAAAPTAERPEPPSPSEANVNERPVPLVLWLTLLVATLGAAVGAVLGAASR